MRGHALVLLVILALVAPTSRAVSDGSTDALVAPGRQLARRGDYTQAEQFYADLAARNSTAAPRALLLQAQTTLADGNTSDAEALVQQVLNGYPGSDQTANAYFALEQIRRAAGDCKGALRALDAYVATAGATSLGPYIPLQRAQCAARLGDWPSELSAATTALATDGGGPRLTEIEALERAAEADLKLGRKQDALDFYNRSLSLASTRAYTAEMLYTTATIARASGQASLAGDRYRAVVVDYADQARGPDALDALADMGLDATVSPLQAGLVRFNAKEYRAAIRQFDEVDASSPDWGTAQVNRAEALLKLSDLDTARQGLQAVVDAGSPSAGSALLRLGQLDERDGDEATAESHYLQMAQAAPDRVAEALFHVGFTRLVRNDGQGALSAWQTALGSGPPSPALQSQLQYWQARALPDGSADSQETFNRAAAAAPESYYGLRAQEQLAGTLSMASLPINGTAWLTLSPSELQERDAWFAAQHLSADAVQQEVSTSAALRRAATLLDLGLQTEAGWEVDGLVQQYAAANDVAHMSAVADWATAHDQPQMTLRIGKQMRDLVGLNGLPRALQKEVFPAGWGDIVGEQASAFNLDPLLMLAVIRQESSFDPRAQSGAQARGLTQIVPSTARTIAARLGNDDFGLSDLFKPAVSVQFGSWFLSSLVGQYHGRVFPTLAAYDAGSGNVARWIARYGDDPDLLVEEIPFAETQTYLRIVYDNYYHYRALYRP